MSIFASKEPKDAQESTELQSIFSLIEDIGKTSSTNEKMELLKERGNYDSFKKVLVYALDSRLVYNVKKFPNCAISHGKSTLEDLFEYLDYLSKREGVNSIEKTKLFNIASSNFILYELAKRICNKDLKCGMGATLVNKVFPGLIFEIPYCRCSTDKKISNIKYPAYAQEKADGMFTNVIIADNGKVNFLTRDGKELKQLNKLQWVLETKLPSMYHSRVLQGELRIMHNRRLLNRQEGNGILTSCQYGTADQVMADKAILCLWHSIPLKDFWINKETKIPYEKSLKECRDICLALSDYDCVRVVPTVIVESYEEAWEFYLHIRGKKGEGVILKNFDFKWKNHTSTNQIKLKNVSDADLVVVGWNYAEKGSKYDGMMGAIICETKCGNLRVKIGTGFSDELRKMNWDDEIGNVVEVLYESVIKSKTDKIHSLYLPRFNGFKKDRSKNTADTLEDLLKR